MEKSVAVGQEFWIVAAGCSKQGTSGDAEKESFLSDLKSSPVLSSRNAPQLGPWKFQVPDGERSLLFGSFDNLIRLTDDLAKSDSQVDSILHRLERQYVELDPGATFSVRTQRQEKPFLEYLSTWQWDEAKYPKTRSILDNLTLLMSVINRLDDETRNKTAQYNELKTQKANLGKKEGAMLTGRDLVDVLTPDTVRMRSAKPEDDDFIYTDHLTTIPVILPKGSDVEFLKAYETMSDHVVPKSAKPFMGIADKDGNTIWRVVVFKSAAEAFKKACRERRYIVRDFEYSEEAYKKLQSSRAELDSQVHRQFETVKGLYQAAWSDAMVAWIHIKAMRVFVESVLRYGMPPKFAAFIVSPKPGSAVAARKALADKLGKSGGSGPMEKQGDGGQDEGEEYFPYVSFSFTPFNVAR